MQLLLGEQPIAVPSALGELLMGLLRERRDAAATGPEDRTWLYPAHRLGQSAKYLTAAVTLDYHQVIRRPAHGRSG